MFDKLGGWLWYVKWFTLVSICALMVDMVYVFWPWPAPHGVAAFAGNLRAESQTIAQFANADALAFIQRVQGWVYLPTFQWSGLHSFLVLGANPPTDTGTASDTDIGRHLALGFWQQIQVAYIGVMLFAQRLAVLALSAPLFGVVLLASATDGALAWYRRRTSVGRESGFIYHRAKHLFNHTLLGVWVFYLLPPIPLDPLFAIPPAMLLVGLSARVAVGNFKKYL
jgi:integrating conjugative element membrane protein (TIGR03747 family)